MKFAWRKVLSLLNVLDMFLLLVYNDAQEIQ